MKFWHTVMIGVKLFLSGLVTAIALWLINFLIILFDFPTGFIGLMQSNNTPMIILGIIIAISILILQFFISGFIGNKLLKIK